jgi:hypothetical protein
VYALFVFVLEQPIKEMYISQPVRDDVRGIAMKNDIK